MKLFHIIISDFQAIQADSSGIQLIALLKLFFHFIVAPRDAIEVWREWKRFQLDLIFILKIKMKQFPLLLCGSGVNFERLRLIDQFLPDGL